MVITHWPVSTVAYVLRPDFSQKRIQKDVAIERPLIDSYSLRFVIKLLESLYKKGINGN